MNYCQDGLQVYFATETQQYDYAQIYGHYELQPNEVNGRPYFKRGSYGFWWDGIQFWYIGYNVMKGQQTGFAHYDKDEFCPHQLSEWDWILCDIIGCDYAGNDLGITCKYYFHSKQNSLNFHIKKEIIFHGI